jgi:hypothetical protein
VCVCIYIHIYCHYCYYKICYYYFLLLSQGGAPYLAKLLNSNFMIYRSNKHHWHGTTLADRPTVSRKRQDHPCKVSCRPPIPRPLLDAKSLTQIPKRMGMDHRIYIYMYIYKWEMRIHIHIKVIYYGNHVSLWGMNRINRVSWDEDQLRGVDRSHWNDCSAGDSATLGSGSCSAADLIVHNGYTGVFWKNLWIFMIGHLPIGIIIYKIHN